MIRITADMFSGRENPVWEVEGDEAKTLLQEIGRNPESVAALDEGPQGLGYRGLIVESLPTTSPPSMEYLQSFASLITVRPRGLKSGRPLPHPCLRPRWSIRLCINC
jgi:hypothetical protein